MKTVPRQDPNPDPEPPGGLGAVVRRIRGALGPGVITGAADDDPSGIATYSLAGAQLGPALLWTALLTWPLMAAVQTMCARIGMVTGRGLMGALRRKFSRRTLGVAAGALLLANTINIGADLSGMADAAELLLGVNSHVCVVLFGTGIAWATIRLRYAVLARVLKWLALVLFVYVIDGFYIRPPWGQVFHATLVPAPRRAPPPGPRWWPSSGPPSARTSSSGRRRRRWRRRRRGAAAHWPRVAGHRLRSCSTG